MCNIYVDFDGVILDTAKKLRLIKKSLPENITWSNYLKDFDFYKLYKETVDINESLNILRELSLIKKNLYILTQTYTYNEELAKRLFLVKNGILAPVIACPPDLTKHIIIKPNKSDLLVDDNLGNIKGWDSFGGEGILFDPENIFEYHNKTKSLEILKGK